MLRYSVNGAFRRLFSSFKPRRVTEFDPAKEITSDVVIYKNNSTDNMRYLFYFAGLNFVVWLVPGYLTFVNLDQMYELAQRRKQHHKSGVVSKEVWEHVIDWVHDHRIFTQVLIQGMAFAGFVASCFFCTRAIRQITILKGGDMVSIRTWTVIPSEQRFIQHTVPVSNVSALTSLQDKKSAYIRFKVKGHPFFYLLDKKSRNFLEPTLYEKTVGYSRSLK